MVRCNNCMWTGQEDDLKPFEEDGKFGDGCGGYGCPNCKTDEYLMDIISPGMVKCTVDEDRMGFLTITFENGKDIFLQGDSDRAQFAVQHGLVVAPDEWDGDCTKLPDEWWEADYESITECLEDYKRIAE